MSTYTYAISELRQLLADNPNDKRATRKRVIGDIDGVNVNFRTYDKRIITTTFLIYVNNVETDVSLDDPVSGEFTFTIAPSVNTKIEATYYWQWWIDDELKNFLNKGAESCGIIDSSHTSGGTSDAAFLMVPQGLRTAVLYFAAGHAQAKLIQYMQNRKHSGEFLLEQDGNDDTSFAAMLNSMQKQQDAYFKQATIFRDDVYKRQGRRESPSVAVKVVNTRRYGPFR